MRDLTIVKNAKIKLSKNQYLPNGAYPIIDQGQNYIAGYTDNIKNLLPEGQYIIFGDHTTCLKYFDGKFAQGADGIKILCAKDMVVPKYLYYAMNSYKKFKVDYARHWRKMADVLIPVPTIKEQQRIVALLDKFDALTTDITSGLPAEITARQKQYEYYRDKLLTFKELAHE